MTHKRLKTLTEFRSMSAKPFAINVLRDAVWSQITTDLLVPGDICSIVRSKDDCPVPCDLLLLEGSCIANEAMLSGESTPQLKEPMPTDGDRTDKLHVLSGGTKILQVVKSDKTPDGGCFAYVTKTGFSTQQGELLRMIIYSSERVTANNLESLIFILFLLIFAVIASAYVWTESTKNPDRKKSKILLDCILIITSVIPPELPMELSLAVNNSIMALTKSYIYCTEPFRIPFAGKIDIACFDKTGTLTVENLTFTGVTGVGKNTHELICGERIPNEAVLVLAGVNSLVRLDEETIGDPMELDAIQKIGWTMQSNDQIKSSSQTIKIMKRFAFSSSLKRMSTVFKVTGGKGGMFVGVKGAPEVVKKMCKKVPGDYDDVYKGWARRGSRILALAIKPCTNVYAFVVC